MRVCVLYDRVEVKGDETDPDDLSQNAVLGCVGRVGRALEGYHEVVPVRFTRELVNIFNPNSFDMVFNLCEGVSGDARGESHVAAFLELLGIPYTGSDPLTLGTCLRKDRTKALLAAHDVRTPRSQAFAEPDQEIDQDLRFPLIVKPVGEDAGIGIGRDSIVTDETSLRRQVARIIAKHRQPALVEEYVDGRELNVAVLGNGKAATVLPVSEIVFDLPPDVPHIVSYEAKWIEGSAAYTGTVGRCPAPLEPGTEEAVRNVAVRAFQVTGCRDYARIDIRLRDGVPYVLEVNPNPDIDVDSGFVRSAKTTGLFFDDLMRRILALAAERSGVDPRPSDKAKDPVWSTSHLDVRRVSPDDVPLLVRWFNDAEVGRFMDEPDRQYTEEGLMAALFVPDSDDMDLIVTERASDRGIGFCSIYNTDRSNQMAEVSFLIGEREFRGKGYSVEMVHLLRTVAFDELGLDGVLASVARRNRPSMRVFERTGFRKVGVRRQHHHLEGKQFDEVLFELLRTDLQARDTY